MNCKYRQCAPKTEDSKGLLWRGVKAAIIVRYGSMAAAARDLNCSKTGLRAAAEGACPGILKKMKAAGIFAEREDAVAVNSHTGHGELLVTASNSALSGNEWEFLAPWGDHPNQLGLQRLTPASGRAMASALNAKRQNEGANFRGAPIYAGHPDLDPKNYPDDRRIGRVDALDGRADGLYALISWNDLGEQNRQQGYWITNNPVITGVRPWTANSARFSSTNSAGAVPAKALRDQVADAALDYQKKNKCDWATAWNAQKKDRRFMTYFNRRNVGANSIVDSTTPGAAKKEAKSLMKEHRTMLDGYSAITSIAKRQKQLMDEKGLNEHEALLQAQIDRPQEAATAARHKVNQEAVMQANDRKEKLKEFNNAVQARQDKERSTFTQAWTREKRERKQKGGWTPDTK